MAQTLGMGDAVAVAVGTGVFVGGVPVGVGDGVVCPHVGNLNLPMRVCQFAEEVVG